MIDFTTNPEALISTGVDLFKKGQEDFEIEVLLNAVISIDQTGYENWDGGIYLYTIFLEIPTEIFGQVLDKKDKIEKSICSKLAKIIPPSQDCLSNIKILPQINYNTKWRELSKAPSKNIITSNIERIKKYLIDTSTGQTRIQDVDENYKIELKQLNEALKVMKIDNPINYKTLWDWYLFYKNNNLPSYSLRRKYVNDLINPLIEAIESFDRLNDIDSLFDSNIGWPKVDNNIILIKKTLFEADCTEKYQSVGLICRETIISLSQIVFDKQKHKLSDVEISDTDAKRMIEAYLSYELSGSSNETIRKLAKSSLDLANELTHKRTADFKLSALCAQSTISLINIIAIISGKKSFDL
ncbi:MAG TPA: hypothetical protein PLA54_05320 [Spirochaetota bacterium]|nr:hypothetical protein [Spirochaetota bacterium]HQE58600.1 hypothetical protein [Spirochaetota bacterium]